MIKHKDETYGIHEVFPYDAGCADGYYHCRNCGQCLSNVKPWFKSIDDWAEAIVIWRKSKGFKTDWDNFSEKVMLIITELGRSVDAHRKDSKALVEHELIDGVIRYLDLLGSLNINIQSNLKREWKNLHRRKRLHGKKY